MQKQPELVGLPAVTGGSVGFGIELVFLDQVFHSAAGAVDLLVKMFGPSSQIGDDEADIAALMGRLNAGDHLALLRPTASPVTGLEKAADFVLA